MVFIFYANNYAYISHVCHKFQRCKLNGIEIVALYKFLVKSFNVDHAVITRLSKNNYA